MLTRIRFSGEALVWDNQKGERWEGDEMDMKEWIEGLIANPMVYGGFGDRLVKWEATVVERGLPDADETVQG